MLKWDVTNQLGKEYVKPIQQLVFLLTIVIIYQGLTLFTDPSSDTTPVALVILTSVGAGILAYWLVVQKVLRII